MTVAAAVLAAGGASRFVGGHKLIAPFRGRPLADWAMHAALKAGLDDTIVVIGAVELEVPPGIRVLRNDRWKTGLASSLQLVIEDASARGHDAVVIGLADQPLVPASAWRGVAEAADSPIAVATYGGIRGNPVRIARSVWADLPTSGDEGARALMRHRPELVREVPCEGTADDVDTVEDLARWS